MHVGNDGFLVLFACDSLWDMLNWGVNNILVIKCNKLADTCTHVYTQMQSKKPCPVMLEEGLIIRELIIQELTDIAKNIV